MALPNLFEDPLVEIIKHLSLWDIFVLRRVSKRISLTTHSRPVWVNFIHQVVFSEGLPWPSYALTLSSVPTSTLEALAVRCFTSTTRWRQVKTAPLLARHIRQPSGTISWTQLYLSRWLITASTDNSIRFWDLEHLTQSPALQWNPTAGFVETGLFSGEEKDLLVVNTRLSVTHVLQMRLPHIRQSMSDYQPVREIHRLEGFHQVVAISDHVLAFARRKGYNQPFLVDYRNGATVCLDRGPDTLRPQSCVAVWFGPTNIFVAKDWDVHIYSNSVLQELGSSANFPKCGATLPLQSIEYPGGVVAHHLRFIPATTPNRRTTIPKDSALISNLLEDQVVQWVLKCPSASQPTNGNPIYRFHTQAVANLRIHYGLKFNMAVGETGSRYVWNSGPEGMGEVGVDGGEVQIGPGESTLSGTSWGTLWTPDPRAVPDWPVGLALDEATGLVAMAMATGVVWLLELASLTFDAGDEATSMGAEKVERTIYRPGGLQCVDLDPEARNEDSDQCCTSQDDLGSGWVWIHRLVEPEDPLPQPPGWGAWTPVVQPEVRDKEVTHRGPSFTTCPSGWTDRVDNWSQYCSWRDEYYGERTFWFNRCLRIPGVPVPLMAQPQKKRYLIQASEDFFVYDLSKESVSVFRSGLTLDEILDILRSETEPRWEKVWWEGSRDDPDAWDEYDRWFARVKVARAIANGIEDYWTYDLY